MKIFISQPMNGVKDEKVLSVRSKIYKAYTMLHPEKEIYLIESFLKTMPEGAGRLWCLGDSIKLMDQADLVIFAPGWHQARGCNIEYRITSDYGIPVLLAKFDDFGDIYFTDKVYS